MPNMNIANLTSEQRAEIRQELINQTFEDCKDRSFLRDIIESWVDSLETIEDQIRALSDDPKYFRVMLTFDPETGKEWE